MRCRTQVAGLVSKAPPKQDIYFDRKYVEEKDENGNVVKRLVSQIDPKKIEDLRTYVITDADGVWSNDMAICVSLIKIAESTCNVTLNTNSALTLFDVWEALGVDISTMTPEQVVMAKMTGWIKDYSDDTRSNYVSFGISDEWHNNNEYAQSIIRNREKQITLTFNFDGDIYTKVPGHKNIGEALVGGKYE